MGMMTRVRSAISLLMADLTRKEIPYILAAGDIRSGSPRQIVIAVGDGAMAATTAQKLLLQLS